MKEQLTSCTAEGRTGDLAAAENGGRRQPPQTPAVVGTAALHALRGWASETAPCLRATGAKITCILINNPRAYGPWSGITAAKCHFPRGATLEWRERTELTVLVFCFKSCKIFTTLGKRRRVTLTEQAFRSSRLEPKYQQPARFSTRSAQRLG